MANRQKKKKRKCQFKQMAVHFFTILDIMDFHSRL